MLEDIAAIRTARINPRLSSDLIPFAKDKGCLKPNDLPKVNKFHFRRTLAYTSMRRLSNMEETKCGPTRVGLSRKSLIISHQEFEGFMMIESFVSLCSICMTAKLVCSDYSGCSNT